MEFTKEDLTKAISTAASEAVIDEIGKVNEEIEKMKTDLSVEVGKQIKEIKDTMVEKSIHGSNVEVTEPEPSFIQNSGEYFQMVAKSAQDSGIRQKLGKALEVHLKAPDGINTVVDSEGGFLPTLQVSEQIQRNAYETGQLASRATKMPLGANSNRLAWREVVEDDRTTTGSYFGAKAVRVNEGFSGTSSKMEFRDRELPVAKMMVLMSVTDEALEDARQLSGLINEAVPQAFGKKLDDEMLRGTGAGQALGIIGHNGTIEVAEVVGQTADTVRRENVNSMAVGINPDFFSNAAWFINPFVRPQLNDMTITVGTGGSAVFMPENNLAGEQFARLLGREIVPTNACSKLGDVGDIILADFSQYILVEKGGVKAAESMHVLFDSGQQKFRFTWRVSGGPRLANTITPEHGNVGDKLAAFVTLANRA